MTAIWKPTLAALLAYGVFLVLFVGAYRGDLSALVCVGRAWLSATPYDAITVDIGNDGYDGSFYYVIAQSPWQRQQSGIDNPALRHMRILYPAMSWLLSGGDKHRLLWVMPLVNLLAIGALVWLGALFAVHHGMNPWWACLLPVIVVDSLPLARNLTDVTSTTFIALLLVAWVRRWPWWVVGLAGAAVLFSREHNVCVVGAVLAVSLWQRRLLPAAALTGAFLLWVGWVCTLRGMYGIWPFLASDGLLGWPFRGMILAQLQLWQDGKRTMLVLHLLCLVHLSALAGLAAYLLWTGADRVLALIACGGAALALIGGTNLYDDVFGFMRVFAWLPLALWLGFIQTRRHWPALLYVAPLLMVALPLWSAARHRAQENAHAKADQTPRARTATPHPLPASE